MQYRDKVKQAFDEFKKTHQPPHKLAELMEVEVPQPAHGDRWGHWVYDQPRQVLEFKHPALGSWYEVDLDRANTVAEMWDWVEHMAGKVEPLGSVETIGHLVQALKDIKRKRGWPS